MFNHADCGLLHADVKQLRSYFNIKASATPSDTRRTEHLFKTANQNTAENMSDDEKPELMFPAFPVEDTGEEYDLDLPPTTANEYLRRVQIEASNCPDVVVANLDTSKFLAKQTVSFSDRVLHLHENGRGSRSTISILPERKSSKGKPS